MKKIFSLFLALSFLICTLNACSSTGIGEQMVFPIDSEPKYLDPQIVYENGAANIVLNCYEGLVTYGEGGQIVPAGCESYDISSDGKTYTFSLRTDAKWKVSSYAEALFAKGEFEKFDSRVTAADYVFAFRRVADSATGSSAFPYMASVKNAKAVHGGKLSKEKLGVRAEGDFTFVVELERADSEFLSSLTRPAFVPCNETFFELTGGRYCLSVANMISNGPFYVTNWADGTAITAKRNDLYHSANGVLPSSVYFSFNNEKTTRGEKVKNGVYEVSPISEGQATELFSDKNVTVKSFKNSSFALLFNCSDEYLQNSNLRASLAASLEKEYFLADGSSEAVGIVPSAGTALGSAYRNSVGTVQSGLGNAKKYLQKAQNELEREGFSLSVLCGEQNELNVRKVMQSWQSLLGVKSSITVEVADYFTLQSRIESGDFQLAFADVLLKSDTALGTLLCFSQSSNDNIFNFSSSRYETLLEAVQSSASDSEYLSALKECEKYLLNAAAIAPIEEKNGFFAEAKGVSGVIYSPGGEFVYFKNAIRK